MYLVRYALRFFFRYVCVSLGCYLVRYFSLPLVRSFVLNFFIRSFVRDCLWFLSVGMYLDRYLGLAIVRYLVRYVCITVVRYFFSSSVI